MLHIQVIQILSCA